MPPHLTKLAERTFEALERRMALFDARSRKRGMDYWRNDAVGRLLFRPGQVRANVHGTTTYDTGWRLRDLQWAPACDCPVGPNCKHAYAVAMHVLELADADPEVETDELKLMLASPDDAPEEGGAAPVARLSTPKPAPARPVVQPSARRELAPPRNLLSIFRAQANPLDRYRTLMSMFPQNALQIARVGYSELQRAIEVEDPDIRCWQLARVLIRHQVDLIPPELAAFAERSNIAEQAAREQALVLQRQLAEWAARRTAVTSDERSLRLVLSLTPAREFGHVILVETRLTSPRLPDQPRSPEQLRQLLSNLRGQRTTLPHDQQELLDSLVRAQESEQAARYGSGNSPAPISPLARLLLSILPSPHVRWSDAASAATFAQAGIVPGELVRFDAAPAELLPSLVVAPDGTLRLVLVVHGADGSQRPASEALLICSRTEFASEPLFAVVVEGVLSPLRSALPSEIVRGFLSAPALPIARADAGAMVQLLAHALPTARAAFESHIATHPVKLTVALDLDADDRLDFRLFALTPGLTWPARAPLAAGEHLFELGLNGQWAEVDEALLAPGDGEQKPVRDDGEALIHLPDADSVRAGVEWLQSTGARVAPAGPHGLRRHVKLTPRIVSALAAAWERRPAGMSWVGTRAAHALFGPATAFRTRVSAKRSGVDLLQVSAQWESELLSMNESDLARLRAAEAPWVKLSGGWVRREGVELLDQSLDALADLGIEPGTGEQTLSLWQLAQARPETLDAFEQLGLDDASVQAVRELREKIKRFRGLPTVAIPAGFEGELRAYQQQGLDFLAWTSSLGLGAVLADDMGLGKTVQALAWLLHLRAGAKRKGPALVVCPASVVHNWEREARTFAPKLRVQTLTSGPERAGQLEHLADYDLVIT
ncbi:MAG: SNF2-related protein, partial [Candidatus Eisenbacteria bacterium]